MTVYKAVKQEAPGAATLAVDLLQGKKPASGMINTKTNNGMKDVPSVILQPVAVTKDKIMGTIIKDGYWTKSQICTAKYAAACTAAGIK
jgi:D-xylose transport system substrate-binding protein